MGITFFLLLSLLLFYLVFDLNTHWNTFRPLACPSRWLCIWQAAISSHEPFCFLFFVSTPLSLLAVSIYGVAGLSRLVACGDCSAGQADVGETENVGGWCDKGHVRHSSRLCKGGKMDVRCKVSKNLSHRTPRRTQSHHHPTRMYAGTRAPDAPMHGRTGIAKHASPVLLLSLSLHGAVTVSSLSTPKSAPDLYVDTS